MLAILFFNKAAAYMIRSKGTKGLLSSGGYRAHRRSKGGGGQGYRINFWVLTLPNPSSKKASKKQRPKLSVWMGIAKRSVLVHRCRLTQNSRSCHPSRGLRQENQEFLIIFSCTVSQKGAWATGKHLKNPSEHMACWQPSKLVPQQHRIQIS